MKDTEFLITYDSCFSGCGEFTLSGYEDVDELFDAIFNELEYEVSEDDEFEVTITDFDNNEHIADMTIYSGGGYDSILF